MNSHRIYTFRGAVWAGAALLLFGIPGRAQQTPPSTPPDATSIRQLEDQIRELRTLVEAMRVENAQSRAEMGRLREDLQATRLLLETPAAAGAAAATTAAPAETGTGTQAGSQASTALEQRVEKLEESTSLIGAKVDEQHETNVETASKYRARLHGIVLMNAFRNTGYSDSFDLPSYAEPVPRGWPVASVGATLRQSEIGIEIFGPKVAGARTSADVQLDFAGGFPDTGNGVNFGLARLQTASLRLDWQHTSLVAGQDALFLSPLSPTSFASLALPAFAFAGNLWAWTPQLRVEHRFSVSDQQAITLQAGVFDNLNWEFPNNQFNRTPQAGELSGQPAYGLRTAWSRAVHDHSLSFGAAGYYGRQNWTWGRYVDAWAGMADWEIPLAPRLELSGEFYRGVGIGGLGAAVGTSIVYGGNPRFPFTPIRGVDAAGGWAQLKFRLTPKLELNGAVSDDDAFTANIRGFATDAYNFGLIIGRNQGALANVVFRPRSDLVLAGEFRRLRTFPVYSSSSMTNVAGVSAGILF